MDGFLSAIEETLMMETKAGGLKARISRILNRVDQLFDSESKKVQARMDAQIDALKEAEARLPQEDQMRR